MSGIRRCYPTRTQYTYLDRGGNSRELIVNLGGANHVARATTLRLGGREGVALDIFEVPQPCTSRCLSRTMESYGRAGVSAPKTPSVDLSRMCVSCTSYTAITIAYLERGAGKPGASVGLASHRDSRSGCRPGVLLRFAARQGHDHPCGYGADSSHGGAERK